MGLRFVAPVVGDGETIQSPEAPLPSPRLDGQPSLAVLPFRILGDPGAYATLAEGLPHELIGELARLRWLFVIARGSSFQLDPARVDPQEVGRRLGVRYSMAGSVEFTGRRLIVAAELAETADGGIVWADRFEGSLDDVHEFRTQLRGQIVAALDLQIPLHEDARARLRSSEDLDAWSAFHRGLQRMYRFNRQDNAEAMGHFTRAVALDPGFARAHAGLSFLHFQTAFMGDTPDLAKEVALARSCATRGLELDPLDPFVNFTMGRSYWLEGDLESSLQWLERATEISPHYAQGIYARAWTETMADRPLQGRAQANLAMRLSPLDPLFYGMLGTRAFSHLALGEDAEAADWAARAARAPGAHVLIALIAAFTHALAGREADAMRWVAEVRSHDSHLTQADFFRSFPVKSAEMRRRIATALRDLGF